MSATAGSSKSGDMSHSKPSTFPCNDSLMIIPSNPPKLKASTLSFRTSTINNNLARRLNKKKIECRSLHDEQAKLKIQLTNYKRYIFQLTNQKNHVNSELTTIVDDLTSSYEKMSAALDGFAKVRDNITLILGRGDEENTSYLANTSVLNKLQNQSKECKPIKRPFAGKLNKKAVNMVRPMKYGFVVGNPVVSLKRLRRNFLPPVLPPVPLEVVAEDDDEEEEDVNITTVEIAPTPSGLPSPSSPEAASTSATPEPRIQTSPFSETSHSPNQRNSQLPRKRSPRDNTQDSAKDSVKSKRPGPKSKQQRKSLSVNLAVAKSIAIENQQKRSSTSGRRTDTSERNAITPTIKNSDRKTYTISKNQQIQLMTPCRVVVKNLQDQDIKTKQSLRPRLIDSPQEHYSPRPSFVVLDRITTRKKPKRENNSDSDDSIYKFDIKVKTENVSLNESCASPGISALELTPAVQLKRHATAPNKEEEEEDLMRSQDDDDNYMQPDQDSLLGVLENETDITPLKCPVVAIPQIKVNSPFTINAASLKSVNSDVDRKLKDSLNSESSDTDEGLKKVHTLNVIPKINLNSGITQRLVKYRNKPMPLSKKIKLCKTYKTETSTCDEKSPAHKEVACSNDDKPEDHLLDEDNECESDGNPSEIKSNKSIKDMTLCNTQYSSDSSDSFSSNCLSPDQRRSYINEFLTRLRNEDPLEGTSKKFEPKKKPSSTLIKRPAKKSLRILEKKTYTESPDTPVKAKHVLPIDESWHPIVSKKRPRPLSKKKDTNKKIK